MFPLEFPYLRVVHESRLSPRPEFMVGAMMTASHARFGERLAASCHAHDLPLALFEVPHVHSSISTKGLNDLRYTKPNFIRFLLNRYQCPILYLDVDCEVVRSPVLFREFSAQHVDFAIFNWLGEEHTEAYKPVEMTVRDAFGEHKINDRFYRFSHSIDALSDTQLLCSGAVQWHGRGEGTQWLLEIWQAVIERAPRCADDKCLDLAYNNYPAQAPPLKSVWLKKSYARCAWWIYEAPIIDHPEIPGTGEGFVPLQELQGRPRIHIDSLQLRNVDYIFPKDCLLDTLTRTTLRMHEGEWHKAGTFTTPLWLPYGEPRT